MARIRTIKPEFFTHENLFDAEQESGLPLRLAFAGLWTQCDREGRFEWRPRRLKTAILPYDEIDFARVLDALEHYGYIFSYQVNGDKFGCVPKFSDHQYINNKEHPSQIPAPQELPTRSSRVNHAYPELLYSPSEFLSGIGNREREYGVGNREEERTKENAAHSLVVADDATGDGLPSVFSNTSQTDAKANGHHSTTEITSKQSKSILVDSGAITSKVDPAEVMTAWNELAEEMDLPKIQQLTADRRKTIAQRSKDAFWRDNWRAALAEIRGSPFLCGAGNRGWRIDFNFFLRKGKVLEIIEGKFKDAAPPESELPF